jgi:hypothetical protein
MPDLIRAIMIVGEDCRVKRGIWQPFNNARYQARDLKPGSEFRYLTKPSNGVI